MTASQQPDAERAPLTSPAAAGSGPTGHDKAVEIGREIGRFHRPTSVSVVRQSVTCQCGVESTDTDGLERHRAELSLAALRAALAAGDTNVAQALALPLERITEHVPHYGSFNEHRCGDPTEPCRTYDLWRIRTNWREA